MDARHLFSINFFKRVFFIGLALSLCVVSQTAAPAPAADSPTALRVYFNVTSCDFSGVPIVWTIKVNGTVVGTFSQPDNDCTCSPPLRSVTLNDAATLAAIGAPSCTSVEVSHSSGGSYVAVIAAEIDRTVSGTEHVCLADFLNFVPMGGSCGTSPAEYGRYLCNGYQWDSSATYSNGLADTDGDGTPNCSDPDIDNDGVLNASDNCPAVANPGQQDSNGNGVGDACEPAVVTVPWFGNPAQPHHVYSGGSVVLQGVAVLPGSGESVDLTGATVTWDPGDGSGPQVVSGSNPRALELTHTYTGADGTPFTAVLKVTFPSGASTSDTFKVVIRPDTLDTRVNMAIDKGLWSAHKKMQLGNIGGVPSGSWTMDDSKAATGSMVQAFEINGHRESGNSAEDPYVNDIKRALAFIMANLRTVPGFGAQAAGDPDTNANGIGLETGDNYPVYVGGQVVDAIVASGTPNAVAVTGDPTWVKGRKYKDIVQDMMDAYYFGQMEGGGDSRGSWRYVWNNQTADSSAAQWAAIAALAAHDVWGVPLPQFVKDENLTFAIPQTQYFDGTGAGIDGRFGYADSGWVFSNGVAETPSGMIQLIMDGIANSAPRMKAAEKYMFREMTSSNLMVAENNMYAMIAMAKAMRLMKPSPIVLVDGSLDWYRDATRGLAPFLVANQQADGKWFSGQWVSEDLASAFAIIILSPTVFQLAPTASCTADPTIAGIGGSIHFDGSGSFHQDPAHSIVSYSWDFKDATSGSGVSVNHSYSAVGTYNVQLTVTDDQGLTGSSTCPVTVQVGALPPNAEAGGPYSLCLGTSGKVILNGSASTDPDGTIVSYQWDWTPPITFTNTDANTATVDATAAFTALGAGTHDVGLKVTDDAGFTNSEFTTVTVYAQGSCPIPPTAVSDSYTTNQDTTLTVGAPGVMVNDSDPDGEPLTAILVTTTSNGTLTLNSNGSFTYVPNTGYYGTDTFTYKVNDGSLDSNIATVTITINQVVLAVGRMTGGGSVFGQGNDRVTHGMELRCAVNATPQSLEVNWGRGNKFHLDAVTAMACTDDPKIVPNPPAAGFDTMVGAGTGKYNNVAGATVTFTFTDAGEPGKDDTGTITIKDKNGATVLNVSGKLNSGNHQAHKQ
ncbi:MAG: PKD domain-containing protein [Acidobacteria bacterium]|nr:PKD domain-containing protein [Acidobacteriota bacterium]